MSFVRSLGNGGHLPVYLVNVLELRVVMSLSNYWTLCLALRLNFVRADDCHSAAQCRSVMVRQDDVFSVLPLSQIRLACLCMATCYV